MPTPPTIVVGHDGSSFADDALRWALDWARRASLGVTVIRGWSLATAPRPDSFRDGYVPPLSEFGDAVAGKLAEETHALRAEYEDVAVDVRAVHGPAANALIAASESAALVAVGPRGRGGFKGLVLGSVSEQVVRHAKCPVVVVRGTIDVAGTDRTVELDAGLTE